MESLRREMTAFVVPSAPAYFTKIARKIKTFLVYVLSYANPSCRRVILFILSSCSFFFFLFFGEEERGRYEKPEIEPGSPLYAVMRYTKCSRRPDFNFNGSFFDELKHALRITSRFKSQIGTEMTFSPAVIAS